MPTTTQQTRTRHVVDAATATTVPAASTGTLCAPTMSPRQIATSAGRTLPRCPENASAGALAVWVAHAPAAGLRPTPAPRAGYAPRVIAPRV